jgi:prepilin-type N-terminal cleavage/methylation domain-containing protein
MRTRGLTLVELLVAIVIITTLVAAVLPAMTPTTNERRIREASRGLNTYLARQQAQGQTRNRLVGFGLKKLSFDTGRDTDRGVCLEVYAVEQPVPFTGFDTNSAARVAIFDNASVQIELVTRGSTPSNSGLPPGWAPDLVPAGVIRPGDVIEVSGNRYVIMAPLHPNWGIDANTGFFTQFIDASGRAARFRAVPQNGTGQAVIPQHDNNGNRLTMAVLAAGNAPYWSQPTRYKIHRQPSVTSSPPYQLPEGIAIDLQGSGFMDDAPLHIENVTNLDANTITKIGYRNNDDMIFVMFAPDGSIGNVYYNRGGTGRSGEPAKEFVIVRPTSSLCLLLGRRESIPVDTTLTFTDNPTSSELEARKRQVNWLNLEGAWVNVGYQTGSVITTDLANVDPVDVATKAANNQIPDYVGDGVDVLDIRREQIMRSREYARQSARLGGK